MAKVKTSAGKKPLYKKWWFWFVIVIAIIGIFGGNNDSSKPSDEESTLNFSIVPDEAGEYGFENTLNKGTELEETQIVYHIPAGTYNVTNKGNFPGQIEACSDDTHITEEGWEEPTDVTSVILIKPDETAEFTIEDGYYLESHINGELLFELQK